MPTVSIVLPTYNGAKYLSESLDSVLAQTFTDWELIAVDDCSTDNTLSILREYEKKDERIRVIHNEVNKKLPESLNVGFREAAGKYLTWTSDDNRYHLNALATLKNFLDTHLDVALVYATMTLMDESGTNIRVFNPDADSKKLLLSNIIGACFMYRREVLQTIGEYDTDLFCVEDWDYWLRIAAKYNIHHLPQVLYDYRQHGGSLTQTKHDKVLRQNWRMLVKNIDLILQGLKDTKEGLIMFLLKTLDSNDENAIICKQKFLQRYPWWDKLLRLPKHDKLIIFGAGKLGKQAQSFFGDRVVAFADSNVAKIDTVINGIPVIAPQNIKSYLPESSVVIAVSVEHIFDLAEQLHTYNIDDYSIYQLVRYALGKGEN